MDSVAARESLAEEIHLSCPDQLALERAEGVVPITPQPRPEPEAEPIRQPVVDPTEQTKERLVEAVGHGRLLSRNRERVERERRRQRLRHPRQPERGRPPRHQQVVLQECGSDVVDRA
jgi:hypothetical protein